MLACLEQTKPVSVLLVEDDQRFRTGVRTLLDFYQAQQFTVIGEASRVGTALSLVAQRQPNLLLLDLELTEGNGIWVLQQLQTKQAAVKPIVISAHQEDTWIYRAMQAGAAGYVFKSHLSEQLWDAVSTVMRGEVYLPMQAVTGFFRQLQATRSSLPPQTQQIDSLTSREAEVLLWLVRGASNEEIAKHLYVSVATVKAHLTSIFQKLQVTSRTQAIVAALKLGLVKG